MQVFKKIRKIVYSYRKEIVMVFCMFSNLYPQFPNMLYYIVTFSLLAYIVSKTKAKVVGSRADMSRFLLGIVFISSIINLSISYRLGTFTFIICTSLMFRSYRYYRFKVRFLYVAMIAFATTPIINLYAYYMGINYMYESAYAHGQAVSEYDFSGFTCLGMWLSPACGIATIFFVHLMIKLWNEKGFLWGVLILPFIFVSIYVTTLGGSRSALGFSLVASILLIWLANKKTSHAIMIAASIAICTVVALPKIMEASTRIQMKGVDVGQNIQHNSRSALWNARWDEFCSSPIWGIGYSATGIGEYKRVGGAETGSGWLTALSQSGSIGFLLCIALSSKAFVPIRKVRRDSKMSLFFCVLVFMAFHTMFEAYLFQAGWYLCLIYWMLVGILDDYKKYGVVKIA